MKDELTAEEEALATTAAIRRRLVLKNRILRSAPESEGYDSLDVGNTCLVLAVNMFKANGVSLERLLEAVRQKYGQASEKSSAFPWLGSTPPIDAQS